MTSNPEHVAIERALVAIRRAQTRRTLARLAGGRADQRDGPSGAVVELLDAVEAGTGETVTELAAALGVDQPRASRLAAQAVEAGLLRRAADPADGRRSPLVLTGAGRATLDGVRDFRRGIVAEATAAWSDEDRAELARLLTRFTEDWAVVTSRPPGWG